MITNDSELLPLEPHDHVILDKKFVTSGGIVFKKGLNGMVQEYDKKHKIADVQFGCVTVQIHIQLLTFYRRSQYSKRR